MRHIRTSETFLAGHVLCQPSQVAALRMEGLTPEDFTSPYKEVVQVAFDLDERSIAYTYGAVRSALKERELWDEQTFEQHWDSIFDEGFSRDADLPYHIEQVRMASIARRGCEIARSLQDDFSDLSYVASAPDVLRDAAARLLQEAQNSGVDMWSSARLARTLTDEIRDGGSHRLDTGIYALDKATGGLSTDRVSILAARTHHGKTLVADQIALNVALREVRQGTNRLVLIFSPETTPREKRLRLVSNLTCEIGEGVPWRAIESHIRAQSGEKKPKLTNEQLAQVQEAADLLASLPIVTDPSVGVPIMEKRARITQLRQERGVDVVMIIHDYLEFHGEESYTDREGINKHLLGAHEISQEEGLPWLDISQLDRRVDERDGGVPYIRDFQGSSMIEKTASTAFAAVNPMQHWKATGQTGTPPPDDIMYLHVLKGGGGKLKLSARKECARVEDATEPAPFYSQAAEPDEPAPF